jgi:hypothetical protein
VAFATLFGQLQMSRKEVMVLEHDPRPHQVPAPTPAAALAQQAMPF